MKLPYAKKLIQQLLMEAQIEINGKNLRDIQVHNEKFYMRLLKNPILALGESYVEGWWDCESLDEFFFYLLRTELPENIKRNKYFIYYFIKEKLRTLILSGFNLQAKSRAFEVGK
ncbi:MAG: cyclopropane-fatty-acyl-phospholipid synthase, partial [Bradyrhizobium icense]